MARHVRRWVAVAISALVVVLAVGFGVRWWLTAPAFGGASTQGGIESVGPAPLGRTYVASLVFPDHLISRPFTVHVTSARPLIVSNSSHAIVRLVVCRRKSYIPTYGAEPLATAVHDTCLRIHPFETGQHRFTTHSPDIGLEITPRTKGRVVIAGIQLTYWRGLRHGHELEGYLIALTTHRSVVGWVRGRRPDDPSPPGRPSL